MVIADPYKLIYIQLHDTEQLILQARDNFPSNVDSIVYERT